MTIYGTAQLSKRTKHLVKRLKPGEIAVIDHVDIDRVSAESLVSCNVKAVVNASKSISGRYPNIGPRIIVDAGIFLLDEVGESIFEAVADGDQIVIEKDTVFLHDKSVASGTILDSKEIEKRTGAAEETLDEEMEQFIVNTMEYIEKQKGELIFDPGSLMFQPRYAANRCLLLSVATIIWKTSRPCAPISVRCTRCL